MPIRVSATTEVSATIQLVWEVFTDIHRWSEWNPLILGVTSISGGSIWAPGGAFVVQYRTEFTPIKATTRSFVQQVMPGRKIVLSGEVLGSTGTISYEFSPFGPKTIVSASEVFAETNSDYRDYFISSSTERLLRVQLSGLRDYVEGIGHQSQDRRI
jgi:hypothetical protein